MRGGSSGGRREALVKLDHTLQPTPPLPLIETTKERKDMLLLKKYGPPAPDWNLMLEGLA